ncbi:hypothetical protein CPB86DRAFT_388575 [Serendipita vermifera]|nr:hypothetical protein CPB86DRAFT_388575 [Serendipita vermifera]
MAATTGMRVAILDDSYPGILYNQVWRPGGNPDRELNATTRTSIVDGQGFSITFKGNSIGVYGTLDVGVRPLSSYVLDGGTPTIHNITENFSQYFEGPFLYMAAFYQSPLLEYGTHTLQVTIDRTYTGLKGYIFDFLTVGVKEDDEAALIIVDDNESVVQYTGQWALEGSAKYEYQGTTHKSNSTGNAAVLKFKGTTIDVFGTVRGSTDQVTSLISFQIDDGDKGYFMSVNTEGALRPKYRLFARGTLPDGEHTLRVESLTSTEFWLDYFIYTPSPITAATSITTPPPVSQSSQSNRPSLSAIIGGAIGGVAGLSLIVIIVILFFYRRKRSSQAINEKQPEQRQQQPQQWQRHQGGSLGQPSAQPISPLRNVTFPSQPIINTPQFSNTSPLTPYIIDVDRGNQQQQQRNSSSGTGYTSSYQSSGVVVQQVQPVQPVRTSDTLRFVAPPPPTNTASRFVAPIPQKYRQPQVQREELSEHEPTESSIYTDSDTRDTRSPPPNYSAAQASAVPNQNSGRPSSKLGIIPGEHQVHAPISLVR